jgi:non-specific serine/threonine protein kinase/serine/threonine-protein kinase
MTPPDHLPRVREIVGAALQCEPTERKAFLDSACSDDDRLRHQVDTLITAYETSYDLSGGTSAPSTNQGLETPAAIGPYRLERVLGTGGMGQVWLAEQTEPVQRRVAVKLIRSGFYDPQVTQRFLAERQSLALMNHPSIAKVFDAGTTQEGQPYLVMEYVDGLPITEYCDVHALSIRERLRLFQLVCDGVQHAHQKTIIHRDLKPSNILVTEVDGKPVPRIIDFGLAKVLAQGMDAETMMTRAGSILGTLGYMSPEQADSGGEDIDTRSDVYSLGVILYELLVGALPLAFEKLTFYEILQHLREQDAPRPSTRLRTLHDAEVIAQRRNSEPGIVSRQLRGDADAIVLKALAKDRTQRYATPAELAADIERYLRNEPVSAQSLSFSYVAGKYVRRHRVGVVSASAGVLLILAFVVAQAIQLRVIRQERDRADRVSGFMVDMFKVSDPSEARGSTVTAREILDQSTHKVESELVSDPAVQTQLMQVMARTYMGLGLYSRAHDLAQRSLGNQTRILGPDDPKTLESAMLMGTILTDEGHEKEAESLLRKTLAQQSRIAGPEDPATLKTEDALATLMLRHAHYAEAEKLERGVTSIEVRKLGADNPETFRSLNSLASALRGEQKSAEAETLFHQILANEQRVLGTDHPYLLVTMHNLANMLAEEDRFDEAEPLYRQTLAIQQRVLGPDHPETASTLTTLANTVAESKGRQSEAESLYREALATELRVVGPDHIYTTHAKEGLANCLSNQRRYAEADTLLREVLATRQRTLGPEDTDTLLTQYNLADVMLHQGSLADAEKLTRKTLDQQSRALDKNDPDTMATETLLAKILFAEDRYEASVDVARRAFEAQRAALGPAHSDTQKSLDAMGKALNRLGRYPETQGLYLSTIREVQGLPQGDPSDLWYDLGRLAAESGHKDDAFNYFTSAVQAGFHDVDYLQTDERLTSLRKDPRFALLVASTQKSAVQASQKAAK